MLASQLSPEDTHRPSMFRSYIKVILSYFKLSYFVLSLCITEQHFTPQISVVYSISSQISQLPTNKTCLDGELALLEDWLCRELALQGNVVQARAGQGFQVQARTYINCSLQYKILKFHVYLLCVMAPEECLMHNSQKICQVVFRRITRIW